MQVNNLKKHKFSKICKVCESDVYYFVSRIRHYSFCRCPTCGICYIEPLPTQIFLHHLYDDFYSGRRAFENYEDILLTTMNFISHRLQVIFTVINKPKSLKQFLDVGCGAGHHVYAAQKFGLQAYGIDVDRTSVNRAKSLGLSNIMHTNLLAAPFTKDGFHIVQFFHVLEHISNPKETLLKANLVLNNNGVIIIDVPNQASLISKLKILLNRIGFIKQGYGFLQPPNHIFAYTLRSLRLLLETSGFNIRKVIYYTPAHKLYNPTSINYKTSIKWFIIGILYMIFGRDSYISVYAVKKR